MKDLDKLTYDFLLNEGEMPSVISYVQSVSEILEKMKPASLTDYRRLEVAKDNLANIKRHVRRLEMRVGSLQEELKTLQEEKLKKE